jgi:hypothetical protein
VMLHEAVPARQVADIMSRVKHCCDSTPIASPSVLAQTNPDTT